MDSRAAIRLGLQTGQFIVDGYLADLSDSDLLVRAVPGTNHIAWQLGHLVYAEHFHISSLRPGSMPELPAGFGEKYTRQTAANDDPTAFLTKAEYQELMQAQRTGTLAQLDATTDAELDAPGPEKLRHFLPTVATVFSMQGTHWVMHAGQWAIIRRELGKPPLF